MSTDCLVTSMYHSGMQSLLNIVVDKSCLTACNMIHVQVNEKENLHLEYLLIGLENVRL